MRIGIVSTWSEKCGISEYCQNLVFGLKDLGVDIKVAANYPKSQLDPDSGFVKRYFHTPFLTNQTTADIEGMVSYLSDCDIIHFQFETNLYHISYFLSLIIRLKELGKPIVFTMHSSGMWFNFFEGLVNHFITHEPMWCSNTVIPMGIKDYGFGNEPDYNSIVSFGLGRNNDDIILNSIKNTNATFRTTYGHQKWLKLNDLVKEIQKSWIISLYYPQVGADVSSSAAILAIGCNRPILVSNTKWFKHIINYSNIYVCDNEREITNTINYLINQENRQKIRDDIDIMSAEIMTDNRTFNDFLNQHVEVYQKILNK